VDGRRVTAGHHPRKPEKTAHRLWHFILYITHDLTTAYQISDNIIVLYRGCVAEVGDVDLVIKNPQHPYSRLLISSIPTPDVDDR
jgi:peptide/nickel transport system ATP-binding protein